ncbi:flavodoxin [Reticulibacter mediterranei]|uniref:Flavodoxin n=1 Tax=Reticulibacter mediterranei TaxID=2778369 RepID=A0A8J3J2F3_9CHLR|nr:flavodoxin domain-containing protein [Reticulibacter mediterranei]GHP01071.1 flavodoxin [Reticulibacter mediterranei]
MTSTILIAYATRYGSTQEVAEAIADRLHERGLEVELKPIFEVSTLEPYRMIVLGGPIYMDRWHPEARRFLKRHYAALQEKPTAIFALGPIHQTPEEWQDAREQLDRALEKAPLLKPIAIEMFGGVISPAKLHFPFNHLKASDARNWTNIIDFADELAELSFIGRAVV